MCLSVSSWLNVHFPTANGVEHFLVLICHRNLSRSILNVQIYLFLHWVIFFLLSFETYTLVSSPLSDVFYYVFKYFLQAWLFFFCIFLTVPYREMATSF